MSHNDSWMPLYIGDYLGDTMELDGPQHGAYLLLLMYYWRNGPLPTDDAKLAKIARTDIKVWKKTVGPAVKPFFHENGGRLHQKRADIELAKAEGISTKRRAAAEARWNGHDEPPPNGSSGDANAFHVDMQNQSKPDAPEMQTASKPDANGMLRARGLHLHLQKESKRESPLPHDVGNGTPQAGTPPRSRSFGNNPRKTGDNPRANGTNPRAAGTNLRAIGENPRATGNQEGRWLSGAIQVVHDEKMEEERAQKERDAMSAYMDAKGLRYGTN